MHGHPPPFAVIIEHGRSRRYDHLPFPTFTMPNPTFVPEAGHASLRVFDSVRALAFIGDLSMGQPTDHSLRTGWLAVKLAHAAGLKASTCDTVREVSLLRWSGCTANAAGFAEVFGANPLRSFGRNRANTGSFATN
jgi:hypothetical protein